jgi:hypothetical protein
MNLHFPNLQKVFLIKNILKYFLKIHFIFKTNLLKFKKKTYKKKHYFLNKKYLKKRGLKTKTSEHDDIKYTECSILSVHCQYKISKFLIMHPPTKKNNRKYHSKITIMRIVLEIKDNMFKRKKKS